SQPLIPTMSCPNLIGPSFFSLVDEHRRSRLDLLEQLDDVSVAHAYAAGRAGLPHGRRVRTTVDVNIAAHGVAIAQPVIAALQAAQPEDAGKNPVPVRMLLRQLLAVDLAGRAAADEDSTAGRPIADLGANHVPAARGAIAAVQLARPLGGAGDGILAHQLTALPHFQALLPEVDLQPNPAAVHHALIMALSVKAHASTHDTGAG